MIAVVLYDSHYGNTAQVARAIASVLEEGYEVRLLAAGQVDRINERPDLLVVGSPTHHRQPTSEILRAMRSISAEHVSGVTAAAFDTRYNRPRFLTGAASLGIAQRLGRRGARVRLAGESFFVTDKDGPLLQGELERARNWATQVLYLSGGHRSHSDSPHHPD